MLDKISLYAFCWTDYIITAPQANSMVILKNAWPISLLMKIPLEIPVQRAMKDCFIKEPRSWLCSKESNMFYFSQNPSLKKTEKKLEKCMFSVKQP